MSAAAERRTRHADSWPCEALIWLGFRELRFRELRAPGMRRCGVAADLSFQNPLRNSHRTAPPSMVMRDAVTK